MEREYFKTVNGVRLFIKEMGQGPPCFVVHEGPGLDHSYFFPFLRPLAERFRLIALDLRGCGRSEKLSSDQYTMALMVEDLEALRKAFAFEKVSLLGHSFGGFLAMQYALKFKDRVQELFLISSAPSNAWSEGLEKNCHAKMTPEMKALEDKFEKNRSSELMKKLYLAYVPFYFWCAKNFEKYKRILEKITYSPECFHQIELNDFPNYDLRKNLQFIKAPTFILVGDKDMITNTQQSIEIAQRIPNSTRFILNGVGHFPFIENQEAFLEKIYEWLNKKKGGIIC